MGKQPTTTTSYRVVYRLWFVVPLLAKIMVDPVVAADGHTYERLAIERVYAKAKKGGCCFLPSRGNLLRIVYWYPNAAVQAVGSQYASL